VAELGRYGWIRSWLPRFWHVFGMIKLAADRVDVVRPETEMYVSLDPDASA
jgi:hypothetical protein